MFNFLKNKSYEKVIREAKEELSKKSLEELIEILGKDPKNKPLLEIITIGFDLKLQLLKIEELTQEGLNANIEDKQHYLEKISQELKIK